MSKWDGVHGFGLAIVPRVAHGIWALCTLFLLFTLSITLHDGDAVEGYPPIASIQSYFQISLLPMLMTMLLHVLAIHALLRARPCLIILVLYPSTLLHIPSNTQSVP